MKKYRGEVYSDAVMTYSTIYMYTKQKQAERALTMASHKREQGRET